MTDVFKRHEFLSLYLKYVENTESPRLFHVWCALSAISAALGRRCWFDMGVGKVWPNMYVVLVGPPGTRKGYAIKAAKTLLRQYTQVRFAPNDTGGQRQGLIAAMTDVKDGDNSDQAIIDIMQKETVSSMMNLNGSAQAIVDQIGDIQFDNRDPRTMYITSSELNSILGENNTAMLTFLQEMWDGEPYKYKLKNTEYEIRDAVLGIVGGTTPTQISIALPPEAVGQGFTSRVVFVYADRQYQRVARPSFDHEAGEKIARIFGTVFDKFEGQFHETPDAAKVHDQIYARGVTLKDPRFVHYCDRRQTHLQKAAMALAAGRGSQTIEAIDFDFADELLTLTEQTMPDALGEYGMSRLSAAKQRLMEFVNAADKPLPVNALFGWMSKDMNIQEYKAAISELHNAKKLSYVSDDTLGQCVIGISSGQKQASRDYELFQTLTMKKKVAS